MLLCYIGSVSTLQYKLCPQCKNAAPLDAVECRACRRKFRSTSPLPTGKGRSQVGRWFLIACVVVALVLAVLLLARAFPSSPR